MRRCLLAGAAGLALSVHAGTATDKTPPPPHRQHAPASAAEAHGRVAQHEAEVRRLQQEVARQESASRQAEERQRQQDQAIAELQKQLQEVRAKPAADHH